MTGDVAFALTVVGVLLLEATNYLLGGDKRVVAQAWAFLAPRKNLWLGPVAMMLALLGLLVVLTTSSAGARLIYALF
jgi:hypothetical protein